jgi:hypothetical protein
MKAPIHPLRFLILAALLFPAASLAQENSTSKEKSVYDGIKAFSLAGGSVAVNGLTLNRDRVQMSFTGTFYFATPVDGKVTGALFVGDGRFSAAVPPNEFEKGNLRRLLGADLVESDFKTAILRFSDDTFDHIGKNKAAGSASEQLQKQANESDARILKQTGANLTARIALSLLNKETPGFFFATFEGGKRGKFHFMLDYQNRIPVANFDINGGEKGLIFTYKSDIYFNEVWMAFYSQEDYKNGTVEYADVNDQIDVTRYDMNIDLRQHKKAVVVLAKMDAVALAANLRALTFQIGEGLSEYENYRLNKQLRLKSAKVDGQETPFAQEDWQGGFTVFTPGTIGKGKPIRFEFLLEGDFMYDAESVQDCHYPRSNETWFPRHGYLDRAEFDLTFRHPKRLRIASVGERVAEQPDPEDKNMMVTKYRMPRPVPLITFALAPFQRHAQMVRFDQGGVGDPIPIEFNSISGAILAIKEDFILAELDNSLRYFTSLFGKYPYPSFGAAFHPFSFGQGFPSLLMIPPTDRASKYTYVFIAHETAHQWWGDIVSWRSYRDQWLSEGFAEYSGILYTEKRSGTGAREELLSDLRDSLKRPPQTEVGLGKGRLVDVGPIILGHRLSTRKTFGAYQTLIYNKGALVLRMLHFLLSDPASAKGDAFFDMMTDFVTRYQDQAASTDDFRIVANEHFAKSPIGKKYNLNNLDWFFRQWVYHSELPSYQMEYQVQPEADGKFMLSGTVTQGNVPDDWFMPLPVLISFGGNQTARGTVHALGPKASFQIRLPAKPTKVELDPNRWVLSDKTSTKGN